MSNPNLEFITIGRILAPWGVKGKLKVKTETDFPQRFASGAKVYISQQPMTIDSAEWHRGKLVVKFSAIDSIAEAQKLRGKTIEIPHRQVQPLPEGQFYHFQMIGLEVRTTQGEPLGKISEILTTESNDVYIVRNAKGEILIPAIEDVVKSVDLEQGHMVIEPIEGLLSQNQKETD
ncbi:MAG: ribosome maturation factor RimM [Dehalococcoidales bacterium]